MLAVTFAGMIQVLGMLAAFYLGRQVERPKDKWPQGSLLQGGWAAWRVPIYVIIGLAFAITVFLPTIIQGGGLFGGLFRGLGGAFRGGYGSSGYGAAGYGGAGYGAAAGYGGAGYGGAGYGAY